MSEYSGNITAGSNVFAVHEEWPEFDQAFVEQVSDYDRLKRIVKYAEHDPRVTRLNAKQKKILEKGIRCSLNKSDPCFGFTGDSEREICKCINSSCKRIYKCNPEFSEEEEQFWTMQDAQRELYGHPDNLREHGLFYIVDLISAEEMRTYDVYPQNEGLQYENLKNKVLDDDAVRKEKTPKTKLDPVTGRMMVVVGYEWKITDNASYENESLVEIWRYADEVMPKAFSYKNAEKLQKKTSPAVRKSDRSAEHTAIKPEIDYYQKQTYEKGVLEKIRKSESLSTYIDDPKNRLFNGRVLILTENPAEQAYLSGQLLKCGVRHGFSASDAIQLALIADYSNVQNEKEVLMLTGTITDAGCKEATIASWKKLADQPNDLYKIRMSYKQYKEFKYVTGKSRWCCDGMYGISHVCVLPADLDLEYPDVEEYCSAVFEKNGSGYEIMEPEDGRILGSASAEFCELLRALTDSGEISEWPAEIDGVGISIQDGTIHVIGMGHLKFDLY